MQYIAIQPQDFDVGAEVKSCYELGAGAVVSFVGLVRDYIAHDNPEQVVAIELEHYPAMTEKVLAQLVQEANRRWPLLAVRIIHRVGYIAAGGQIVSVVVASSHRHAAFAAAEFLMDFLKTQAPFWKKEYLASGDSYWVAAKSSDQQATTRWSTAP